MAHSGRCWARPVEAVDQEIEARVQRLLNLRFGDFDPVGDQGY